MECVGVCSACRQTGLGAILDGACSAIGETVIFLHLLRAALVASTWMEREREQNDSLADGQARWDESIPSFPLAMEQQGYFIGHTYKVWSPGDSSHFAQSVVVRAVSHNPR